MMKKFFLFLLLGYAAGSMLHKISPNKPRFMGRRGLLPLEKRNESYHSPPRLPLASGQPVIQNTISFDGLGYLVYVTIGTPQQSFPVYLDTRTSDLVVSDSTCNQEVFMSLYCNVPKFNSNGSSTYVKIKSEEEFNVGQDTIHPSAIQQGLVTPFFTVYLATITNFKNTINAGTITYGGLDTENCGPVIAYQPLSSTTYYQFTLSGFSFGSYSTNKAEQAVSDTANNNILVPLAVASAAAQQINATDGGGYYSIPCDAQLPPINIKIGANTYVIDGKRQILDYGFGNNQCAWVLYGSNDDGFGVTYVLGYPFIQQYCHIYDMGNKRIGFASIKNP